MRFEIYQQGPQTLLGGGDWRWRLKGGNNEIIAQGEGYRNRADCVHAINLVRGTSVLTPTFEDGTLVFV